VACGGNNFTAISVDACTGIVNLSCENTSISTLNVAPLSLLESLVANDCLLTTMDCSNNLKLQKLYLQGNPLTSLILATGQVIGDLKVDNYDVISYK
jgi:Leucine-rich repeat (LRR) protein